MKNKLLLTLALVLTVSCLGGCAKKEEPAPTNPEQTTSDTTQLKEEESKWPEEPLTMVIAYSAGGSSDVICRELAVKMQEQLGQDISCINVTGASGSVAGQQVFDAEPDGYTIFGGLAHSPSGWRMLDYADISWDNYYGFYGATSPYVLFVKEGGKYSTFEGLLAAMQSNPGKVKWGNAGIGSINHLTGEMFVDAIGVEAATVPYGGGREAAIKVIANEVDFSWAGASDVMDLAETGEIRIIGVATDETLAVKSSKGDYEAPSLTKSYPELSSMDGLLQWGIAVNRQTPDDIVLKIEEAFKVAVEQESFKELCKSRYLIPNLLVGEESDKMSSYLESIYAWGLYDNNLGADGVTPENFNIPKEADYVWPPNDRAKNVKPWPSK